MIRGRGGYVYFMRPIGAEGPVKIGWSAQPYERLASMATWSPQPLEIAATIEGDRTLERRFHHRFRHSYSHREWFLASSDLSEVIARIVARDFDTDELGEPMSGSNVIWSDERREMNGLMGKYVRAVREREPPARVAQAAKAMWSAHGETRRVLMDTVRAFVAAPAVREAA